MYNALRRQQESECEARRVAQTGLTGTTKGLYHVKTLHILDTLLEATRPDTLVVIAAYRTSCGMYKRFLELAESVWDEQEDPTSPVIFVRHDVSTEYDGPSDISQLYRIKAVPVILLLNRDGAVIDTTRPIASVRQHYRHRDRIEHELNETRISLVSKIAHHHQSM